MNSCPEFERLIAYRLNLLADDERSLVENHLVECQKCQRKMAIEDEIDKELSVTFEPGSIEEKILTRLRLSRELKSKRSRFYTILTILNTILIVAIVLCLGIVINELWMNILPELHHTIVHKDTLGIVNAVALFFLFACLFFGFRKSILKLIY
ncbi:MAG: anti-sigma factor family protein [bacterium]